MNRICAPIALFVYNRPEHTRRTVIMLRQNALAQESDLVVFSDAPRKRETAGMVQAVRDYMRTVDGFKTVKIVERATNFGLAASITRGVTDICAEYGRVIVLEDDIETSPHFLTFMNDALDFYADVPEVAAVSGFHLPSDTAFPETFFQCDAECWGWATWRRAWSVYQPDGAVSLRELERRNMQQIFDQEWSYPYMKMLRAQIAGKNSSWAVRWRASVILRGMLSLYPGRSLTRNIGADGSGTHSSISSAWDTEVSSTPIQVAEIPLVHSDQAYDAFVRFNRSQLPSFKTKVIGKLKAIFSHLFGLDARYL
jgi:hypothetical protein